MKRKIAIGLVIYNSNASLIFRLQEIIKLGFSVYIFDNSPDNDSTRVFAQKYDHKTLRYITCGKNVGLGYGITALCAEAYYEEFGALVFFDQDTVFKGETIEFIENFYTNNQSLKSSYSTIVFNSKNHGNNKIKDVLLAISSGSMFFLENLKKINWHNEKYFVDCVDYEFCLRSNNNNLKIGEYSSTPGFDHESEQPDVKYMFFGRAVLLRKYSAARMVDAISASVKLIGASIRTINFVFAYTMARSLFLYVSFQVLARIVSLYQHKKEISK